MKKKQQNVSTKEQREASFKAWQSIIQKNVSTKEQRESSFKDWQDIIQNN